MTDRERGGKPVWLTTRPDGVTIALKVQPRASRNAIEGERGGELVVRVTAPPVDTKANEAVIELLAEALGCAKSAISIIRGETSRHKVVLVRGVPAVDVSDSVTALNGMKTRNNRNKD